MGHEQSRPAALGRPSGDRRVNWWEAVKLGSIAAAVAALQWLRFTLLTIEEARESERRRRGNFGQGQTQKGNALVAGMSPETRMALVSLIDHQLTPVLVDQWRLSIVKVLLDPEEVPVLPDEDPQIRHAILESLKSYQEAQDRRPTFRDGVAPSWHTAQPASPSSSSAPQDRQQEHAQAGRSSARHANPAPRWPPLDSNATLNALPSAPPLYPTVEHPSAHPLAADTGFTQDRRSGDGGRSGAEDEGPGEEDCGICMDAKVEVSIVGCGHQLCCECAKAICCLEGRAPQCPFCRGAMRGVEPVPCP